MRTPLRLCCKCSSTSSLFALGVIPAAYGSGNQPLHLLEGKPGPGQSEAHPFREREPQLCLPTLHLPPPIHVPFLYCTFFTRSLYYLLAL